MREIIHWLWGMDYGYDRRKITPILTDLLDLHYREITRISPSHNKINVHINNHINYHQKKIFLFNILIAFHLYYNIIRKLEFINYAIQILP